MTWQLGREDGEQGSQVALIGSDSERSAPRPPISRHRAFPAVVALWFAALLGLGSLVLPVVLLERGAAMTGIAAFVPAASPPLGLTARGLIALAAAVVGALAGVAIARRVARTQESTTAVTFASRAPRPLDVNAELGGEGLANGFGQPVTRRRALAIAEYDQPADAFYTAPLPGADEHEPLPYGEHAFASEPVDTPFEPCDLVEDSAEVWNRAESTASCATVDVPQDFESLPPEPCAAPNQDFEPAPNPREAEPLPFAARDEPLVSEPAPAADEPELVQLVQRLKTSLERRREGLAAEPAPLHLETASLEPALAALPNGYNAEEEPDEDLDEDGETDGAYSSLLAMRGPYTPGASARVHIEIDQPEVVDDPEPDEPADTDAALRAALAKLQRTGGSA